MTPELRRYLMWKMRVRDDMKYSEIGKHFGMSKQNAHIIVNKFDYDFFNALGSKRWKYRGFKINT